MSALRHSAPPGDGPPWKDVFVDPDAHPPAAARIQLDQVGSKTFVLRSSLRFTGDTGVASLPDAARTLRPADLGPDATTDLVSVPAALTWFVGRYGVHTPAALLHDRLIGSPGLPGVSEQDADRFFRFMLKALGVPFLRLWLMWAAVAFGTRWRAGGRLQAQVVLWSMLSVAGMAWFVYAIASGHLVQAAMASLAPLPFSLLWGKQCGAGIVAAYSAPWLAPPTVLSLLGYGIYWLIEKFLHEHADEAPMSYREF